MTKSILLRTGMVLAFAGLVAGCGIFDDEEILEGERIHIREQRAAQRDQRLTTAAPALPAPVSVSNWTQTNGRSNHASGHIAGPSSLSLVWSRDAGSGGGIAGSITSAPIVVGGRVFTMDAAAQVSAFDAGSGSSVWETDLSPEGESGEDGFGGGLASEGGTVFATTGFGEILALSGSSGEILWRYKAVAPFRAPPAVAQNRVLAVTRDNQAIALSARSGDVLWRVAGISGEAGLLGGASPAIQGDLAVLPFASGEVMGVQFSTGRQIWSAVLGGARRGLARSAISDVSGDPVIAGRAVVAANQSGRRVAIDGQTGRRGWTRSIGSTGPLWAAGQSIFMVSDSAEVLRLDLSSGRTIWNTQLPEFEDAEDREDPIAYSGPAVIGGRVYVTDSLGNVHSLDASSGAEGAIVELSDGATSGFAVSNGTVYILSDDAQLQAFR